MDRRTVMAAAACSLATPRLAGAASRPVIGYLSSRAPAESAPHLDGFKRGLAELGYADGRDVAIAYRWAEGRYERLPALAEELVAQRVTLLAAVGGAPSALAARRATRSVPVVYVIGDDPVRIGLAESLARPGGNLTGVSFLTGDLGGKRLGLLCELLPKAASLGLLINPGDPGAEAHRLDVATAAQALGRRLVIAEARTEAALPGAFEMLVRERVEGLVVQNDPFFDSQRNRLVALASRHALPAIYHIREFPAGGGLMSYGASLVEVYRQAGRYAGRVLKGERAGELPVWRPTTFELVINTRTARALGVAVPQVLLLRADEVLG